VQCKPPNFGGTLAKLEAFDRRGDVHDGCLLDNITLLLSSKKARKDRKTSIIVY